MVEENPTENEKADSLEKDRIKLERFKVWGKIIVTAITVVFGSVIAAYINYQIQTRQLDQQELLNKTKLELQQAKAKADQRQAEMKYLGDFIDHALSDDYKSRGQVFNLENLCLVLGAFCPGKSVSHYLFFALLASLR